jgi:hypothetical protein
MRGRGSDRQPGEEATAAGAEEGPRLLVEGRALRPPARGRDRDRQHEERGEGAPTGRTSSVRRKAVDTGKGREQQLPVRGNGR